jgi:alkylation response protein AidB-like acyl-CoA dehydrogenase
LLFDNVRVPAANLLGVENDGFKIAMVALDEARLNAAATSLGLGSAAIDHALAYARERVQFGKPIIDHQALSFLFAELATELCSARALWQSAIAALTAERSRKSSTLTAMAKAACTDFGLAPISACARQLTQFRRWVPMGYPGTIPSSD